MEICKERKKERQISKIKHQKKGEWNEEMQSYTILFVYELWKL